MTGRRLAIAVVVMGLMVPAVLFIILDLRDLTDAFAVSATCLFAWAVAHLMGDILTLPRMRGRSNPVDALRQWEKRDEDERSDE